MEDGRWNKMNLKLNESSMSNHVIFYNFHLFLFFYSTFYLNEMASYRIIS